jgi:flagellar motor switch/type III secretory pathway protein FliN
MITSLPGQASVGDLADVAIEAAVELGRTNISLRVARSLRVGDVVAVEKFAGEALTVRLNDHPFAEGEIVVHNDWMCCRLIRLSSSLEARKQEETS